MDDCLICAKDKFIQNFQLQYTISAKGEITTYIDVDINRSDNKKYKLRQPHLIEKIITLSGMQDSNRQSILVVELLLHRDLNGKD